jgi:prolyl oligopeptidase
MLSIPILTVAAAGFLFAQGPKVTYPKTEKVPVTDTLHGTKLVDDYRWLEDAKDPKVQAWTADQEKLTRSLLEKLPQRGWLAARFEKLWRYDDESTPKRVLVGDRLFFSTKKAADEHWVFCTKEKEGAPTVELLNPNKWGEHDTLDFEVPSRDGKYVAYGRAKGGDENPVTHILEVATMKELPDTLLGWRQEVSAWLPDNSGFYYCAKPKKGEVPEGQEDYWHSAYFHKLGTAATEDRKVFSDEKNKELWHYVDVSEDGKYEFFFKSLFDKNEVSYRKAGSSDPLVPIASGFDALYGPEEIEGKLFITTDWKAPRSRVMVTDADKPGREHWKEFIPEAKDNLQNIACVAGKIYASYLHDAYSLVKVYDLSGRFLRDLPFPTVGSGGVSGHWSQPEVWVHFSSFAYPPAVFKYDFQKNALNLYHKSPIPVDVSNVEAQQVFAASKDGTKVPVFLIHRKDMKRDGTTPCLLTGYGGFNISMTPRFSTLFTVWLEAGGAVAIACLRGGGEYGQDWHHGGWREKKQNVFDDFIAAGEWLVANKVTAPSKLAIEGGSNGGLLVGAALTQRPDLFKAVLCEVPLLDMVRYQKFGVANIWAEEYGGAEDPAMFKVLLGYSPYHRAKDGVKYPATLVVGSENDARVDPVHARKMVARLQAADKGQGPILLMIQRASGHGGGTTIKTQIEQTADTFAFLMDKVGMKAPGGK